MEVRGDTDINAIRSSRLTPSPEKRWRRRDGVFISCTGLRTVGAIEALEQDLGRPVVSAIQAIILGCAENCRGG